MCLILFRYAPNDALPLLLVGNRDEFFARPTAPLHRWHDDSEVFAGRDLQSGGTWFAASAAGRFAAVTNIRTGKPGEPRPLSRGALVLHWLKSAVSFAEFQNTVVQAAGQYAPFNLLVGDTAQLANFNSLTQQWQLVPPGIHGLSNADLDTDWPKLTSGKALLSKVDVASGESLSAEQEMEILDWMSDATPFPDDVLPDTGVGLAWERRLSSRFILGEKYGTRASYIYRRSAAGSIDLLEKAYDRNGLSKSRVRLCLNV